MDNLTNQELSSPREKQELSSSQNNDEDTQFDSPQDQRDEQKKNIDAIAYFDRSSYEIKQEIEIKQLKSEMCELKQQVTSQNVEIKLLQQKLNEIIQTISNNPNKIESKPHLLPAQLGSSIPKFHKDGSKESCQKLRESQNNQQEQQKQTPENIILNNYPERLKNDKKMDALDTDLDSVKQINGQARVDEFCPCKDVDVYETENKIYSVTLNQSKINYENNLFMIIQVLKTKGNDEFYFFSRWGRVGHPGQNMLKKFNSLEPAIKEYERKLNEKTGSGDFRVIEIEVGEERETKSEESVEDLDEKMKKDSESCKLPKPVIDLISMIFNMKMINNQMKEIGYDAKKMPLGKLSKDNISSAYEILEKLSKEVQKPKQNRYTIEHLCNDFYSYIPHDFGFQRMESFILDNEKKVKEKIEMIESIQNIQILTRLLEEKKESKDELVENQVQVNYEKLKCTIKPLEDKKIYNIIEQIVQNTHARTHNQYSLKVLDIFEIDREGEDAKYTKEIKNKVLLWHGSRLTNFVGILSEGLRIVTPEAPLSGYMLGKGVYFADMCSKQANFCFATKKNNIGLMLLCEVALGEWNDKYYADYYAANLPTGKHSTRGRGRTAPDESSYVTLYDDVRVPFGEGKMQEFPKGQMGSLLYNEFVVYDVSQIKIKYLLKLDFQYKY